MKYWYHALFVICGVPLIWLFCSSDSPIGSLGGSGTETIGTLIDTLGNPVTSAAVRIDTVSPDSTPGKFYQTFTNATGRYSFSKITEGTYTLSAYTLDSLLFLIPREIHISYAGTGDDSILDLGVDTMRAPGYITGTVLLDSIATAGVLVYVHGLSFSVYTDGDGAFTISKIPEGTYTLSYRYLGYKEITVSSVQVMSGQTTHLNTVYMVQDATLPPAAPGFVHAIYDTAQGVATVMWERVSEPDMDGYAVYRKNMPGADSLVMISFTRDTMYRDTIFTDVSDTNSYSFRYQITAIDTLDNESGYSPAADVNAVSPTAIRTFFTWTLLPDVNDTLSTGQTVVLGVSYVNKTRRNILLRWYTGDPLDTVRIVSPASKEGADTLRYAWQDTGTHRVCVEVLDERGDVWRDSCVVTIGGIVPVDSWETFYPLTHARRFSGAAIIENTIYAVGGAEDLFIGVKWVPTALASIESFTAGDSAWTSFSSMPTARYAAAVVVVQGKLYVIGGMAETREYTTVEVYNPQSDIWETAMTMPGICFGHAACVIHDSVYVFGGIIKTGGTYEITDSIHVFDPFSGQWSGKGVMSFPRAHHQVAVLDSQIYILGGQSDLYNPEPAQTMERYNPADNTVIQVSDMTYPRMHFGAAVLNGRIYAVGGFVSMAPKQFIAHVEAYDPAADTWVVREALPSPAHSFAICVDNNSIYILGGSDGDYTDHLGQRSSVLKYYP